MSNKYDHKGRIRNKVAVFRISEEENQMLDWKVTMSAQAKSDYIIGCILDKEKQLRKPFVFWSLHNELVRFVKMYGTPLFKMMLKKWWFGY